MDDIEEVVTKDATFNGSGHLVDASIDETSDKGQREIGKISEKNKVEKGKKKGDNNHTKKASPFTV